MASVYANIVFMKLTNRFVQLAILAVILARRRVLHLVHLAYREIIGKNPLWEGFACVRIIFLM